MTAPVRGLFLVYTGNGKGKTSAAVGAVVRATGHGYRATMLQFIKSGKRASGERLAAARLGIEIVPLGDGFTWLSKDIEQTKRLALDAWERAKRLITAGDHDLIVLDEFTYPLQYLWIDASHAAATIAARPPHVHVIVTGRTAPEALVEAADLVTEMREVKHPYQSGIPAQRGIDF
ncbi:MAG: cob(I)yrinic acid a,c-diamide adenosyltransferase [Dehalococcoidia bacterium]|nr:cob(I)yrinic acid a,c-diamide adenosyltransferase [Dehalococcoidia bacterium]